MMGTALLKRSDMTRYGPLMTDIRDQHGYGIDVYPKILAAGHDMLEDYARSRKLFLAKKKPKSTQKKFRDPKKEDINKESDTGVMYSQDGGVPGTNKNVYLQIKCRGYGAFGHHLSHCPETERQQNLNVESEEPNEEKEEEIVEGDQHMQLEEMMEDAVYSSSDGLYLLDFRECQF